jgi:hypothetical protein
MKTSSKIQVLLAFCCLVFVGCSSVPKDNEQTTYEDAVRIKPEYSAQYFQKAQNAANRDGRTLRGYVSHIQIMRDSAQNSIDTVFAVPPIKLLITDVFAVLPAPAALII